MLFDETEDQEVPEKADEDSSAQASFSVAAQETTNVFSKTAKPPTNLNWETSIRMTMNTLTVVAAQG